MKLFAAVDQGPGKHIDDLLGLLPSRKEMLAAAEWVLRQDAGAVFPSLIKSLLEQLGYGDVAAKL